MRFPAYLRRLSTILILCLVVALSWVSLASNAKTFRSTTPASAKLRANIFVIVIAVYVLLAIVLFNLILKINSIGAGTNHNQCMTPPCIEYDFSIVNRHVNRHVNRY